MNAKVSELVGNLKNENAAIRRGAAYSLGLMGDDAKEAVPALREAVRDTDEDVRNSAAGALAAMHAKEGIPDMIKALVIPAGDHLPIAEALASFGKDAAGYLKKALALENANLRFYAASALGMMGKEGEDAIPALIGTLGDEDEDVRLQACMALENIGEASIEPLVKALEHEDWKIRRGAAQALGYYGPPAKLAVVALQDIVKEESNEEVKKAAADAIEKIEYVPEEIPGGEEETS